MNVVKCINGHFFDSDTYSTCPHCGGRLADSTRTQEAEKPKKKGLFSSWKKNSGKTQTPAPAGNTPAPSESYMSAQQPNSTVRIPERNQSSDGKTEAMPEAEMFRTPERTVNSAESSPQAPAVHSSGHTIDFWQSADDDGEAVPGAPTIIHSSDNNNAPSVSPAQNAADNDSSSLSAAIRRASANSEGKTASYFSAVTNEMKSGAEAAPAPSAPADPVVGWLVAISGPHFGCSFAIAAGKNSIGRSSENKIVLDRDNSVSREKHALIVYEPKKRNFFIQPGESSGLTYLNDDYITESNKLGEKDIIEIGGSKLMFIPLCGENFTWEDYMTKE